MQHRYVANKIFILSLDAIKFYVYLKYLKH